ncbi:hypothetical protein R1flu_003126 [Riccia fluitans]|uniref:TFIIS N-terminal domain-containing protein n=1 Tax=Riccia fluitans TaxID=41844 RepID=A0ABD1Y8G4_9MARC
MTPRSRETFIRKSLMKRYSQLAFAGSLGGSLLGLDGKEKPRVEMFTDAVAESEGETPKKASDEATKGRGDSSTWGGVGNEGPVAVSGEGGAGAGGSQDGSTGPAAAPGGGSQIIEARDGRYRSTTVISFLRAALLKRSQRPTLDEAAKKQVAQDMAAVGLTLMPAPVDNEDKQIQTDPVTVREVSEFANVLKRSASCPARMFWVEQTATAEQRARHRSWMEEHGLVDEKTNEEKSAEGDDEVEIIIAEKAITHPEGQEVVSVTEGTEVKEKKSLNQVQRTMKKKVNKLASESLEALGSLGEEISQLTGGADIAFKMAALISRWKKVAKATNVPDDVSEAGENGGPAGAGATGEGGAGKEGNDFEWEDYEGEEGEEGDGRGRRRKRSKGMRKGSSGTLMDELGAGGGRTRRSLERDSIGKSAMKKSLKYSGQGFELGKLVPIGFAKMMNINTPPKAVKFFNERQLTKLITSVYVAKIDADTVDDAADNERQSSCEFVYDFMLNLYGLKRLAESAVWGLFKKIKHIISQKKIDKAHKVSLVFQAKFFHLLLTKETAKVL